MKYYEFSVLRSLSVLAVIFSMACSHPSKNTSKTETNDLENNINVTFIELGSVRCIPCQKMQIVMKSIETKYADQVKVVFYDVWTPAGKPYAEKYTIKVIPTQVFLDKDGKEFFRHEGYFPEEELIKVLHSMGVE